MTMVWTNVKHQNTEDVQRKNRQIIAIDRIAVDDVF